MNHHFRRLLLLLGLLAWAADSMTIQTDYRFLTDPALLADA